jgi:hypothetical protein
MPCRVQRAGLNGEIYFNLNDIGLDILKIIVWLRETIVSVLGLGGGRELDY